MLLRGRGNLRYRFVVKKAQKQRKTTAEGIARSADKGEDVSGLFTNDGNMVGQTDRGASVPEEAGTPNSAKLE